MTKIYPLHTLFLAVFLSACTVLPPEVPPPKRIDPADQGKVLIKSFRYMEAYDYLVEVATDYPDNAKARTYLAEVCRLLNRDIPALPKPTSAETKAAPAPKPATLQPVAKETQAQPPKKTTLISHIKPAKKKPAKKAVEAPKPEPKPEPKAAPAPTVNWVNPDTPMSHKSRKAYDGPQTNFVTSADDEPTVTTATSEQPVQSTPKAKPQKTEKKKKTYLKSFKSSSNKNTLMKYFGF